MTAAALPRKRRALVFRAPQQVEVVQEEVPPLPAGGALVQALVSAISAGTELLVYRGLLPATMALDETLASMAGGAFRHPFRYGYATVGRVLAVGAGVDAALVGRRVFAFHPHASVLVTAASDLLPIPDGLSLAAAALYASQETAVNLVLDGQPRLGERVAVLGQGVVGLLTTALLGRFPLAALVAVDPAAGRAAMAGRLGATAAATEAQARALLGQGDGADLTFELSGNPAVLDTAIALTGREGRVVVGSFYGDKRAPVDLGGHFHRGRLTLISSQVSHLGPALGARWDRRRRTAEAFRALAALGPMAEDLCSHRVPFAGAAEAYRLLDGGDAQPLQILLTHEEENA